MRRTLALLGFALCGLGMTCLSPPPDTDGTPQGARDLEIGRWQRDALDCGRFTGDCADWYRIEVPGEGTLRLDVAKVKDERPVPEFTLVLGEASGRVIAEETNDGRIRLRIDRRVRAGTRTLAISTPPGGGGAMDYEIRATFQPKPRPKPVAPRFRVVEAVVLEVETGADGSEVVLLDQGKNAGIAPGQRGRLLQDGEQIGEIEIQDVYPDGSRARIRGSLSVGSIASTVAEVDVPL